MAAAKVGAKLGGVCLYKIETNINARLLTTTMINHKLFEECSRYERYLESEAWKKKRQERLELDGCCVICKSKINLQCHHLTYKRLFSEGISDLITLCLRCHYWIHSVSPPKDIPDFARTNNYDLVMKVTDEELVKKMWESTDETNEDLIKKMWEETP